MRSRVGQWFRNRRLIPLVAEGIEPNPSANHPAHTRGTRRGAPLVCDDGPRRRRAAREMDSGAEEAGLLGFELLGAQRTRVAQAGEPFELGDAVGASAGSRPRGDAGRPDDTVAVDVDTE